MAVRLRVKLRSEARGADKGTEVLLDDNVITLGRDKSCQVVLSQMAVSRLHARITRDGSLYFIEDLGSAYGTTINGKPLPRGEKRLLRNGDLIAIAQFDLTFDRIADAPQASEKTSFIARHVVKDVMRGLGSGEGPYFRVMNGPREGERIELSDAQEIIFGRDEGVDVVLKDDLVSRRHAKVRRDWSGTHVEDLGSRNGIRVNKKRTTRKTLRDRDELEIGGIRLLYLDPSEVRETPLVLADDPEEEVEGTPSAVSETATSERSAGAPSAEAEAPTAAEAPADDTSADESDAASNDAAPEEAADESSPAAGEGSPEDEPAADESAGADREASERPAPRPGKVAKPTALGNVTAVVKDVRKLVPIAVVGVFCLLAIGLLIAVFAGA